MEGGYYQSERDDWKMFEKSNPIRALYVLSVKKFNIHPAYTLKHNSNQGKQIIFLIIPKDLNYSKKNLEYY